MCLSEEEFIDAACRLYKAVSLPERGVLVNRKRSSSARAQTQTLKDQAKQMFKPKLDPNSRKMAQRRANQGAENVAARLHEKKREYDDKMNQKRF